jgi:hypothetical protein
MNCDVTKFHLVFSRFEPVAQILFSSGNPNNKKNSVSETEFASIKLKSPHSKEPSRVAASLPLHVDANRSNIRNVVFSN